MCVTDGLNHGFLLNKSLVIDIKIQMILYDSDPSTNESDLCCFYKWIIKKALRYFLFFLLSKWRRKCFMAVFCYDICPGVLRDELFSVLYIFCLLDLAA